MFFRAVLTFATLALTPLVSAHGYVSVLNIDGTAYPGNAPTEDGAPTKASVIRRISTIDPVKNATNPYVNCGQEAAAGSIVASAKPGSVLTFKWEADPTEAWPHNTGPLLTYMSNCGNVTCDQFDSSTAKWFKINEIGYQPGNSGDWYQQLLMDGYVANATIPSNIAPGNYLIRNEIIALHLATSLGGAEFYPSCSQLTISGSGTGAPTTDELVELPGAYSNTDPGIFDTGVYSGNTNYTFPGPPIAAFVTGGATTSGSTTVTIPSNNPSFTTTATAHTSTKGVIGTSRPTSTSPSSAGAAATATGTRAPKCHLQLQTQSGANMNARRRNWSRVMHDMLQMQIDSE